MLQAMLIALIAQANTPHTVRMCITLDQVRAGFDPNRLSYPGCRHDIGSGATDHLDMQLECMGKEPLNARLRLAPSLPRSLAKRRLDHLRFALGSLRGTTSLAACP
jgi:hypothetical protein